MDYIKMGKAFKFGDNIDTDQIYPGRFVQFTDVDDIAKYAMKGADPVFTEKISPGDIIVAGKNFGCGSSREHAAITLKAVGISFIIAESFGRIFYRNAINLGLPLIVCPGVTQSVNNEDFITVDIEHNRISKEGNYIFEIEPFSDYVLNILEHGGIKPLIQKQLLAKQQ